MDEIGNETREISTIGPLKILLRGAGLTFAGLIISKAAQYIFRLLIAREGAEEYGIFSLGFTIFSIAGMLSFVGMTTGLYTFIPKAIASGKQREVSNYLKSALHIATFTSLALMIGLIFSSDWIARNIFHDIRVGIVIKILAVGLPLYAYTGLILAVINSYFKNQYDVISKAIGDSIIRVALVCAAVFAGYGLFGISIAYLISIAASFLLSLYFMEYKVFRFFREKYGFDPKYHEIISFSVPLMMSGIVFLFINWTDSILLGVFRGVAEVGKYNTALPTAGLLLTFPLALTSLLSPLVSDLLARNKLGELRHTYMTANKWIFMLNLPALLIMAIFPAQVLSILFGKGYDDAAPALVVLAISYAAYALTISSTFVLTSYGKSKILLTNSSIAAVANIILNIALIPAYGILGAALGTGISLIFYGAICVKKVKTFFGVWPMNQVAYKIVAAGIVALAIPALASAYFDIGANFLKLACIAIATIAAYFLLLSKLRAFDLLDLKMVEAFESKLGIDLGIIKKFMG
ncbi:flippase [Candidatus Micrarchaeota archaeon]|nr:flippase [Candidatus Micrarchaeota archaeon]